MLPNLAKHSSTAYFGKEACVFILTSEWLLLEVDFMEEILLK